MSTNRQTMIVKTILAALFAFISQCAFADGMDAEKYVLMDLQARQVTLNGAIARLNLMKDGADLSQEFASDSDTQQRVQKVYADSGMTSAKSIAWATRNREAITDWLRSHPEMQAEYDRIESELRYVSNQIQAQAQQ